MKVISVRQPWAWCLFHGKPVENRDSAWPWTSYRGPIPIHASMTEHLPSELTGGDPWFRVTEAGIQAVRDESPNPPKLTRSQRRYRAFLKADTGFSFGDWLRDEKDRRLHA